MLLFWTLRKVVNAIKRPKMQQNNFELAKDWQINRGFDKRVKAIGKEFKLGHDVLRHTFISMHVAW